MKKNKTERLIKNEKNFTVIGAILLIGLWALSFFMKSSLASLNVEVERLSRNIKEQKEVNQSLTMKINELANLSGVTPSTAYSMLDSKRRDVSIITIKKFCDGLDITLGEFFSTDEFDNLEQELK